MNIKEVCNITNPLISGNCCLQDITQIKYIVVFCSFVSIIESYPFRAPKASAFAALDSAITIAIYAPDIAITVPIARKNSNLKQQNR